MTGSPSPRRSVAGSLAYQTLSSHLAQAGGSPDRLKAILWRIGAPPELTALDRVFKNMTAILGSAVFAAENLDWARPWRHEVDGMLSTLGCIAAIDDLLRADPALREMFRSPEHDRDHPLVGRGVGRHPVAAALFNEHQCKSQPAGGIGAVAAERYELVRGHVLAVYFEARSRAALDLDAFIEYDGEKEFAAVPMRADPVGRAMRELSLAEYAPLLAQFPDATNTVEFAYSMASLQPSYADIALAYREPAARHFSALQRYLNAVRTLLDSTHLEPRTRRVEQPGSGHGGHSHNPGWIAWAGIDIKRQVELDWDDDVPPVTRVSLPATDEPDPLEEEAEGDMPGSLRDGELELYDPFWASKKMSCMRYRRLAIELRSQAFEWSLDVASKTERARAMQVAQASIDPYLDGSASNQSVARQEAAGGLLVKACFLFGWHTVATAAIAILRVDRLDSSLAESLCYVPQEQICLLAIRHAEGSKAWQAAAFLVPETSPTYRTQLSVAAAATGRRRQRAFLLPDVGGLGAELLLLADKLGRLPEASDLSRRVLGVTTATAARLASGCLSKAKDPINQDPRATLTMGRLAASMQARMSCIGGDAVPAWLVTLDAGRANESRLFYSQVRASWLPLLHQAALATLDGDKWIDSRATAEAIAALQPGWVGCRHVVELGEVRRVLMSVQNQLAEAPSPGRRSAIRSYHNTFTLYAWLFQSLTFGLRAGMQGTSISHVAELWRESNLSLSCPPVGIVDKHNGMQDKSRLLPLTDDAVLMADCLEQHNAAVIQRLGLLHDWQALDAHAQRLFVIDDDENLTPARPAWIKQQLHALGLPVAVNFGRALLRTEWADSGCPGRWIDATLGHFSHGQNWFSKHSSHDPAAFLEAVGAQMALYTQALGLHPMRSLCIPSADRGLSVQSGWQLPSRGRKCPPSKLTTRALWGKNDPPPELPAPRKAMWEAVERHAATNDRPQLLSLMWLLKKSANAHAMVVVGSVEQPYPALDEASAHQLEDEILLAKSRHHLPDTTAASWLRLLLAGLCRLRDDKVDLVTTRVAALTTNPTSPISALAIQRLPAVASWRASLHGWIRRRADEPDEDPRYWAIAIGLSATIHGMAVDMLLLSKLMDFLALPGPRRLNLCAGPDGFSYIDFDLPSAIPGGRQHVRWFLDPLTEMLVLQAPPSPVALNLGSTSRYINTLLLEHGTPRHLCPGNWKNVLKGARAMWSTRVPQHVVQCAQRGISTTSLDRRCWERLFGDWRLESSRSGAILTESVLPASGLLSLEDLTFDPASAKTLPEQKVNDRAAATGAISWLPGGADIDHVLLDIRSAHPWLHAADDALVQDHGEVVGRLLTLSRQHRPGSFPEGALDWLARTAQSLLLTADPSDGDSMVGLRRVASTLLPRLSAEMGDVWFSEMSPEEIRKVLGALAHELEAGTSRPDLRRGLKLLQAHEPLVGRSGSGGNDTTTSVPLEDIEDIENPDMDIRVDARILSVDEYEHALKVLRSGIEPPLRPRERDVLQDLLHLGVWTLARPREYLEARLGDFEITDSDELSYLVREYDGHGLKTKQATRRVPLSLLAPADACERIKSTLLARLAEHEDPTSSHARQALLFPAPEGQELRAYHDHLLCLLRKVLRQVTGDPAFRVYSLRHSGATWLYLALEADNDGHWASLWASQPAMLEWLQQGEALRIRLLGSADRTDRRALLAITKIQGHLAVATTFMHYLHLFSLLQLQAVFQFAEEVPSVVLAAAARISPSSYSEQISKGWRALLCAARTRAGWKTAQPHTVPTQAREPASGLPWLSAGQVRTLLDAHARHAQPLPHIASHFGRPEASIRAVIEASVQLHEWAGATLPAAGADGLAGVHLPPCRMNEAEQTQLDHFVRNIEEAWTRDPTLATDAVGLLLDRTTRLHHEVAVKDPHHLVTVVRFFKACRIAPEEIQIVLRQRHDRVTCPPAFAGLLDIYAASQVKVGLPDTDSSDMALARWIRLRLVDRKGQALSNVLVHAVFTAWLNMCAAASSGLDGA